MKAAPLLDRYTHFAKSYLSFQSVSYLILYVTSRCNLRCNMCFYADSLNAPTGDGLTLAEMEKISKSLPNLMQLTLTGGEPFLRKDLDKIILFFYQNSGVRNFTIPTNGTYLEDTRRVLTEVLQKCPAATFKIGISLDGTKDLHNKIRGWSLSYDKLSATHAMLREMQKTYENLIITMTGVVSSFNLQYARDLVDLYFEKFPSDDYTLQLTRGIPKDLAAKEVEAKEFDKCVDYLEAKKSEYYRRVNLTKTMVRKISTRTRRIVSKVADTNEFQVNCVAGKRFAVLYDTGMLAPCEILHTMSIAPEIKKQYNNFYYGNIREYDCDVQKAVDSELGTRIYSYIKETQCRCTFECAIVASIFYQPGELVKTIAGVGLVKDTTTVGKAKTTRPAIPADTVIGSPSKV